MRNIHKYLWLKISRNKDPMGRPPLGRRRRQHFCFWWFHIINIYGYSLYIPDIFHIYFLNMFHIFSLVCFLIYGVKSRSGPNALHEEVRICMLRFQNFFLRWFHNRSVSFMRQEIHEQVKIIKNVVWMPKIIFFRKDVFKSRYVSWEVSLPGLRWPIEGSFV